MLADDLRKSVLQAAIQGQLTEQLPTDGNARDLLKNIRAEKAKLIKAKKIKPVTLPPISDDDLPFKIPPNWCWVRLGEVCQIVGGGTPEKHNPEYWNGNINWATVADIQSKFLNTTELCITPKGLKESSTNIIRQGAIIIATRVGLGKVCYTNIDTAINQDLKGVYLFGDLNYFYALYFFNAMASYIKKNGVGTTVKGVRLSFVENLLFPLPPLAEQKRIVDKLDGLLNEIELLAADERELDELEKNFPRQMKNSLLQAAIQGQLTKQLPIDGDSRDLLKIIQAEKAKVFKAKKIKAVTLPPISDDELPFKIPANWCWVRLGDVCTLTKGKKVCVGSLPYLDAKYLRGLKDKVLVDKGIYIAKGTKIILVDGENSGEMFEVTEDGYLGSTFQVVELSKNILADYFQYFIMLKKDFYGKNKRGSAIPHLDRQIFFSTLIPLPPIAEQKRIVAKLDELLPLCQN